MHEPHEMEYPTIVQLIEIDEPEKEKGTIRIYRIYSRGGEELVLEKRRVKK